MAQWHIQSYEWHVTQHNLELRVQDLSQALYTMTLLQSKQFVEWEKIDSLWVEGILQAEACQVSQDLGRGGQMVTFLPKSTRSSGLLEPTPRPKCQVMSMAVRMQEGLV